MSLRDLIAAEIARGAAPGIATNQTIREAMEAEEPGPHCDLCGVPVTVTHTRRGTPRVHAHNDMAGRPCRRRS